MICCRRLRSPAIKWSLSHTCCVTRISFTWFMKISIHTYMYWNKYAHFFRIDLISLQSTIYSCTTYYYFENYSHVLLTIIFRKLEWMVFRLLCKLRAEAEYYIHYKSIFYDEISNLSKSSKKQQEINSLEYC